jgi:hypothetical protein
MCVPEGRTSASAAEILADVFSFAMLDSTAWRCAASQVGGFCIGQVRAPDPRRLNIWRCSGAARECPLTMIEFRDRGADIQVRRNRELVEQRDGIVRQRDHGD